MSPLDQCRTGILMPTPESSGVNNKKKERKFIESKLMSQRSPARDKMSINRQITQLW